MNEKIKELLSEVVAGKKAAYEIFKQKQFSEEIVCSLLEMLEFFVAQNDLKDCDPEALYEAFACYMYISGDKRPLKFCNLILEACKHGNWGAYAAFVSLKLMLSGFAEAYDPHNILWDEITKICLTEIKNETENPWAQFVAAIIYNYKPKTSENNTLVSNLLQKLSQKKCAAFKIVYAENIKARSQNPSEQDVAKILSLLEEAQQLNSAFAYMLAANIYFEGKIIKRDLIKCEQFSIAAIKLGHAEGYYILSLIQSLISKTPDHNKIAELEEKAIKAGSFQAKLKRIEKNTKPGINFLKLVSEKEVANNFQKWLVAVANESYELSKDAELLLLDIFAGKGDYDNFKKLRIRGEIICTLNDMLQLSTRQANLYHCPDSVLFDLASCYTSLEASMRPEKFLDLILDAADQGNQGAKLAVLSLGGYVDSDRIDNQIQKIYRESFRPLIQHDTRAMTILALIYMNGLVGEPNEAKGKKFLSSAAALGDPIAQFLITTIAFNQEPESELKRTIYWTFRSACQGCSPAFTSLGIALVSLSQLKPQPENLYEELKYKEITYHTIGSLLGSAFSLSALFLIVSESTEVSPLIKQLCKKVRLKLKPNLQQLLPDTVAFHDEANRGKIEVTSAPYKLAFCNYDPQKVAKVIRDYLDKILAGEVGAYDEFKNLKQNRKIIFTLNDLLFYLSSQESLDLLEPEVFFDCATWYCEMQRCLRPNNFIKLCYKALLENNVGALLALLMLHGKKAIILPKDILQTLHEFSWGVIYNNNEFTSMALTALFLLNKQLGVSDSTIEDDPYLAQAIEMGDQAAIALSVQSRLIENLNIKKIFAKLKESAKNYSSYANLLLGNVYCNSSIEYFDMNLALKHFQISALQGCMLGMVAFSALEKTISKENTNQGLFYLKKAREYMEESFIKSTLRRLSSQGNELIQRSFDLNIPTKKDQKIAFQEFTNNIENNVLHLQASLATEVHDKKLKIEQSMWNKINSKLKNYTSLNAISIKGFNEKIELNVEDLISSLAHLNQLGLLIIKNLRITIDDLDRLLTFAKKLQIQKLDIQSIRILSKQNTDHDEHMNTVLSNFFTDLKLQYVVLTINNEQLENFILSLKNAQIKDLFLQNCKLTSHDLEKLNTILLQPTLSTLSLYDECSSLSTDDFKKFITTIKSNKNIKKLDIAHVWGSQNDSHKLETGSSGKFLSELIEAINLNGLIVTNNNLCTTDMLEFGLMLKTNQSLNQLNLSANNIDNQGLIYLANGLYINSSLNRLNLTSNEFGDKGLRALFKAIQTNANNKLQSLALGNPSSTMTAQSIEFLCEFLKHANCKLEYLDLSHWADLINDKSFALICDALKENSQLKELELGSCSITNKSKNTFVDLLVTNNRVAITCDSLAFGNVDLCEISKQVSKRKATYEQKLKNFKKENETSERSISIHKNKLRKGFAYLFANAKVPVQIREVGDSLEVSFEVKEYFKDCLNFLNMKFGEAFISANENDSVIFIMNYANVERKFLESITELLRKSLPHCQKFEEAKFPEKQPSLEHESSKSITEPKTDHDDLDAYKIIRMQKKEKLDKFAQANKARVQRKEARNQEKKLKALNKKSISTKNHTDDDKMPSTSTSELKPGQQNAATTSINNNKVEIIVNNPNISDEISFVNEKPKIKNDDIFMKIARDNGLCLSGMLEAIKNGDYEYNSDVIIYEGLYCSIRMLQALSLCKTTNDLALILSQVDTQDLRHILMDRCDYFLYSVNNKESKIFPLLSESNKSLINILAYELLPQIDKIYENKPFNKSYISLRNHMLFNMFPLNLNFSLSTPLWFLNNPYNCFKVIQLQVLKLFSFLEKIPDYQSVNVHVHEINAIKMAIVFIGHLARVLRDRHSLFWSNELGKLFSYSDKVSSFVKKYGNNYKFQQDLNTPDTTPFLSQLKLLTSKHSSLQNKLEELFAEITLADALMLFIEIRNAVGHSYKGVETLEIEYMFEEISGLLLYDIVKYWLNNNVQQQLLSKLAKIDNLNLLASLATNSLILNNPSTNNNNNNNNATIYDFTEENLSKFF